MSILKKSIAIIGYLIAIALLTKFQLSRLVDMKQIFMTCAGAYLLYVPANGFSIRQNTSMLGQAALIASYIQAFILVFFQLSDVEGMNFKMEEIALNLRPLFYGFFLWVILQNNQGNKHGEIIAEEMTIDKMQIRLKELSLTNRETEIALEITKGLSNAEIAYELCISESTVKKHISNIFEKIQITKREQIKEKCLIE